MSNMVNYGVEFLVRNVDTNDVQKYVLERYTVTYEPVYTRDIQNGNIGYRSIVNSNGGNWTENGAKVITDQSPLGAAIIGKRIGDVVSYVSKSGNEKCVKVVAIGAKEVEKYEDDIRTEEIAKRELVIEAKEVQERKEGVEYKFVSTSNLTVGRPVYYNYGIDLMRENYNYDGVVIVQASYWSKEFCFAIEGFEVNEANKTISLIGTTFKSGKVYERNKSYNGYKLFSIYNGEFADEINNVYKYLPFDIIALLIIFGIYKLFFSTC